MTILSRVLPIDCDSTDIYRPMFQFCIKGEFNIYEPNKNDDARTSILNPDDDGGGRPPVDLSKI